MYIDFREVPIVLRSEDPRLAAFSNASLQHSFQGSVLHKSGIKLLQFALHYFTGDESYLSSPKKAWSVLDGLRDGDGEAIRGGRAKRAASDPVDDYDDEDDEDDYTMSNEDDLYNVYGEVSDMISYKTTESEKTASKPRLLKQRSYTPMDVQVCIAIAK